MILAQSTQRYYQASKFKVLFWCHGIALGWPTVFWIIETIKENTNFHKCVNLALPETSNNCQYCFAFPTNIVSVGNRDIFKLNTPECALLTHYSFQELYRAFLPALLLRHQGKAEGRFHLRPLPERRPPHLGRSGLRQELRHPFLFHLTTSRSHVHLAQVPARLAHNNTQTTPCRTNNLKRRQIIIPMYT